MKRIAIIPARGGSKRIPRKNIKDFLGKPIICYSIEAALDSGLFDEVMVSTDDQEIAEVALRYGAKIPFMRSAENSNDFATTADAIKEVIIKYQKNGLEFDEICCIYATAPFVSAQRLKSASELLKNGIDTVFTVVQYSYPPQRGLIEQDGKVKMWFEEYLTARSQDLEPIYHDAGQFYMFKTDPFMSRKSIRSDKSAPLILSELEVQDLDTLTDWQMAELKYQLLKK